MILLDFYKQHNKSTVICLGRFDGLHLGHCALIDAAKKIKQKSLNNIDLCVFSFFKSEAIGRFNGIFTQIEAINETKKVGADAIIYAYETKEFFSTGAREFLELLRSNFNPVAIVCGEDYTFGKNKSGNVELLQEFCSLFAIELVVTPTVKIDAKKVSSTLIKESLSQGNIELANKLLGKKYYVSGIIMQGRGDGSKLGFATANIELPKKMPIKNGVYLTTTLLDGVPYNSITNYGVAPTFNYDEPRIETHIASRFDQKLYGKEIIVYFEKYLRETQRFDTVDELKQQLKKDLSNYD